MTNKSWLRQRRIFSTGLGGIALPIVALGLFGTAATAQVAAVTDGGLRVDGKNTTCADVDGQLVIINGDDCDPGGPLTGADPDQFHYVQAFRFGSGPGATILADDGSATFGGGATFNGGAAFAGNVGFTGSVQANQINTGAIVNSGSIATSSLTTGSFRANGAGTFTGSLSSDSFYANSATIAALRVPGAAIFNSTVTVGGQLTASQGLVVGANATIDAGGNRIQNVGTPVSGTDAANKDYVDNAVSGVQGGIATLTTQVADHETRITATETKNTQQDTRLTNVESTNTVQDTRLTSVENINTVQDTRLGAVETENGVQNTRITSVENKNVSQDARMTAIEAVNTTQSNQIGTLQDQVGSLQTSVNGLRRNIEEANGGIAAAVALGGTLIVPDSPLSVSFNLATYRGEQGFSGSLVGRVSPKVYVNAGVGGSTVRGSTAGRVGISFGL